MIRSVLLLKDNKSRDRKSRHLVFPLSSNCFANCNTVSYTHLDVYKRQVQEVETLLSRTPLKFTGR